MKTVVQQHHYRKGLELAVKGLQQALAQLNRTSGKCDCCGGHTREDSSDWHTAKDIEASIGKIQNWIGRGDELPISSPADGLIVGAKYRLCDLPPGSQWRWEDGTTLFTLPTDDPSGDKRDESTVILVSL